MTSCLCCPEHDTLGTLLCPACLKSLTQTLQPRCVPAENFNGISLHSAGIYGHPWDRLLKLAKAQSFGFWSSGMLSIFQPLLHYWAEELKEWQPHYIVPIPGQVIRSRLQSDVAYFAALQLARLIPGAQFFPVLDSTLTSIIAPDQKNLFGKSRRHRERASEWKLNTHKRYLEGKSCRILLVDDVCSTGSTMMSAANMLAVTGDHEISAFVLARASLQTSQQKKDLHEQSY